MAVSFAAQNGGVPRRSFKQIFDYLDFRTPAGPRCGVAEAVSGMVAEHGGAHAFRQTVFRFTNAPFALVDAAGVVAYAGQKLFTFPAGNILIFGATADLVVRKSSAGVIDAFDGDFALGTVTASNNATLAGTEQNIIPTTATPQATGVGAAAFTTAKGVNAAAIAPLDGTATAVPLFLNLLVDDGDHDVTGTPANLLLTGTVTVAWINLGDK